MLEVKGTLARLLAQEDLIVEQRQVDTASFDVERRILTLPLWEKAEASVLDMLIAHEVGHALYTPNKWDFLGEIPLSFVNVVEDVRIEKLMKRRYAGLPKTFYNGYRDINAKDFFQLQFADLEEFGLVDRINLFYKVGMFHNIPFKNDQERAFRDECANVETFDEVLDLASRIAKYQQEQVSDKSTSQTDEEGAEEAPSTEQGSGGQTQSSQEESTESKDTQGQEAPTNTTQEDGQESEETSNDAPTPAQPNGKGTTGGKAHGDDLEAVTDSLLKESIQNLVDSESAPITYIQTPELLLDKVIVETQEWVDVLDEYWNKYEGFDFAKIDSEWARYKSQSSKEVNYLVKEFEMKKSASAYARTTVSKTGVLDCSKLFQYKYNDDIFKKISVTPDGKNHGLIFNLDWSGSMSHILFSTMKQLLNLIQFCNKVGIPFEVYAFTNEWDSESVQKVKEVKENEITIEKFNMIKFASSDLKKRDLDKVMKYMFRTAFAMTYRAADYNIPYKLYLSGTPLNEAIISMKQILPIFQKRNKVEKCHIINLTDGEGSCVMRNKKWGHYDYNKLVSGHIGDCQLRDRKVGRIYKTFGYSYYDSSHTDIFVENLMDNFPNTNVISIRLCSGTDFNRVSYNWEFEEREKNKAQWRKHKSFIDMNSAYTRSLYILSNSLDDADNAFEVKEDARKQDISRAFKKSQKNKSTSKRILNEFISVIA
tara:strand:- start:196 stop:2322 length:2127 start_codon:yes stop_codon:yes gene_type:complete